MTTLVLGPNGCGKSAYAERLAASLTRGELVYIATMIPYGDDGERRVKKHIEQRKDFGFVTIEAPYDISELNISPSATVLLEDVSNLLANAVFGKNRTLNDVLRDITVLSGSCENLIMVSIDGLTENEGTDDATREYIRALAELNTALTKLADKTVKMADGSEVLL